MSYFFNNFSPRQIHLIIFLIVGSLLGYAAYSMKILGLEPCTLCLTQQFFYCLIGISSFVAFLHNPKINFSKLYSITPSALKSSRSSIFCRARRIRLG